jgi:hypothetical protein
MVFGRTWSGFAIFDLALALPPAMTSFKLLSTCYRVLFCRWHPMDKGFFQTLSWLRVFWVEAWQSRVSKSPVSMPKLGIYVPN